MAACGRNYMRPGALLKGTGRWISTNKSNGLAAWLTATPGRASLYSAKLRQDWHWASVMARRVDTDIEHDLTALDHKTTHNDTAWDARPNDE